MRRSRRGRRGGKSAARKLLDLALALAVLAALTLAVDRFHFGAVETLSGNARISDGDSLVIDGRRIRLEGIDAPELEQTCTRQGATYPCGRLARDVLAELIGSHAVSCESRGNDRYGRVLARCEAQGVDLAAAMVERGWAVAYGGYESEEAAARRAESGLWAGSFERPQDWRQGRGGTVEIAHGRGIVAVLRDLWRRWTED